MVVADSSSSGIQKALKCIIHLGQCRHVLSASFSLSACTSVYALCIYLYTVRECRLIEIKETALSFL